MIANICVGVCKIHPTLKVCQGCYRTRLQIAKWHSMTDAEKKDTINETNDRRSIYGDINK